MMEILLDDSGNQSENDGTYFPELDFFAANFSSSSRETLLSSDAV
jgi:hypothetical protein